MSRIFRLLGVSAIVALGSLAVVSSPAAAVESTNQCSTTSKTVVTHLTNRPDSGHYGTWALLDIDRKVVISKVQASLAAQDTTWAYQAVVTDEGTFVTQGGNGLSPNKGNNLKGGVKGKVTGQFKVDFTAPRCWGGYLGHKGSQDTSTGDWVKTVWGGEIQITTNLGSNYAWTYKTACETWLDAYNNDDGQASGAGDITGKVCPEPPKPSPSATATVTPTRPSTSPPAASLSAVPVSLPVTGSGASTVALIAVGLLAVGGLATFLTRRRRN